MKKTAAVIAGTPVDTAMGADFLSEKGLESMCFPVSENPVKQTEFQTSSEEEKETIIKEIIDRIKKEGISSVFVYCNSLSASVDMDKISKIKNIDIITPMKIYKSAALGRNRIGVIAANSQGLSGIEKAIVNANPECIVTGVGVLQAVMDIENKKSPDSIVIDNGIDLAIRLFEKQNVDCIILGCTHFPYFENEIKKITDIEIINPAEEMFEKLIESIDRKK